MRHVLLRTPALIYSLRRWLLSQAWFTSRLLPALPRRVRWTLRRLYFLPSELIERLAGDAGALTPPKSRIFTGSVDDFAQTGEDLVDHLVELGCLDQESEVLDVGSGMGRLAVALLRYRDGSGRYEGLDIVPAGIDWCQSKIASQHPNFRFTLADIYNKEYNPRGRLKASDYRFPYADGRFDLVVLVSVFTHMLPDDMEHYVAEISRALKPGGHCYATYSLLDEESLRRMHAGESQRRFTRVGPHWVVDPKVPELALAYDEAYVRALFRRHGQSCGVHYGSWSGRPIPADDPPRWDQDVVLTTKA
jgi:SAM-dependent methyltransferase